MIEPAKECTNKPHSHSKHELIKAIWNSDMPADAKAEISELISEILEED